MKKVNNITNTDGMNAVTLTTDTTEINSAEATAEEVSTPEAVAADASPEVADAPVVAPEAPAASDAAPNAEAAPPAPERVKDEFHVSNVVRKGDNVEIIVYRTGEQATMTVHYDGEDGDKKIPYVEGVKLYDKLPDLGLVVAINQANDKRVYATLTVSTTELAERFSDKLSELSWLPRTKKRNG